MFSISQFGSVCRNTNDLYSDNDLLIVCEMRDRRYYYEKYTQRGYSVSIFSENQLHNMKKKGSLFLQHLKLESKILVDDEGLFHSFLNNCNLVSPSKNEINNCKKTIEDLNTWSNDAISIAWKADFLYGSSRDYLIKFLATNGIFAFGLDSIIEKCSDFFYLEKEVFQPLQLLRRIKSAYRSNARLPSYGVIVKAVDAWFHVLEKNMNFKYKLLGDNDVVINKKFLSNYERLRYLEVIYISLVSAGYYHVDHEEIVSFILQPNLYQSLKYSKIKNVERYLNELKPIYSLADFSDFKFPLKSNILVRGL